MFGFRDGYVEERYKQVVNACALLQDFKRLPEGDKTGESWSNVRADPQMNEMPQKSEKAE